MLFSSTTFIFYFLPLVLILYYTVFLKLPKVRNVLLLLFSLLFYAWGEPKFVLVMICSIVANYIFALIIARNQSKIWLVVMLIYNFALLFVFKYLTYTMTLLGLDIINITLPIGISFFTFQAVSYVIDVYRKDTPVQKNLMDLGLYISFFPQLIAGPIVRYTDFVSQINNRRSTREKFSDGIIRFCIGLGKKVIIANNMALIADKAFGADATITVAFAWIGAIAYMFQIYFDFSGYSDMAIGLAKMFGFDLLENFNYPYVSSSITEFWRRWHISLSTWFRDYVYIPLGGSRVSSKNRFYFNLFIVWLLTGIWHGANLTFLVWGLYYFVLLAIEKVIDKQFVKINVALRHLSTLLLVLVGWVIFRADSLTAATEYLKIMFGGAAFANKNVIFYLNEYKFFFVVGFLASTPIFKDKKWFNTISYFIAPIILIVSISYIIKGAYNPFIYFNF
ncbi:MAG: MBOAT family protein [Eubacteriales bacterium]|nr:MBOAT family protein [Eubacteriales bacterium]